MKTIFVSIFANNINVMNRVRMDINSNENINDCAAQLAVDIAKENNWPVEAMRFEIVD